MGFLKLMFQVFLCVLSCSGRVEKERGSKGGFDDVHFTSPIPNCIRTAYDSFGEVACSRRHPTSHREDARVESGVRVPGGDG